VVRPRNLRTVIITGLSGSGKSTALKALEDAGFFCVDNLPVNLLPSFLELREEGSRETMKVALVMDLREPDFLDHYEPVWQRLIEQGFHLEIVYLEASDDVLIRRYSQTRRAHPLAAKGDLGRGISQEREALTQLRSQAGLVIDTTHLLVHDLKARMIEAFSSPLAETRLQINLVAFGYKFGLPPEADLVIDVRFLPNPYFIEALKDKDGNQPEVVDYIFRSDETPRFLERLIGLLLYLLPLYEKEGKAYMTVAVGCTGGRHRSVAVVNDLKRRIGAAGYELAVRHRDIGLK